MVSFKISARSWANSAHAAACRANRTGKDTYIWMNGFGIWIWGVEPPKNVNPEFVQTIPPQVTA